MHLYFLQHDLFTVVKALNHEILVYFHRRRDFLLSSVVLGFRLVYVNEESPVTPELLLERLSLAEIRLFCIVAAVYFYAEIIVHVGLPQNARGVKLLLRAVQLQAVRLFGPFLPTFRAFLDLMYDGGNE